MALIDILILKMFHCEFWLSFRATPAAVWSYTGFYSETCSSGGLHFCDNINIARNFLHGSGSNTSTHRGNSNINTWYILPINVLGMGKGITIHYLAWSVASIFCSECILYRYESCDDVIMPDVNNIIYYNIT